MNTIDSTRLDNFIKKSERVYRTPFYVVLILLFSTLGVLSAKNGDVKVDIPNKFSVDSNTDLKFNDLQFQKMVEVLNSKPARLVEKPVFVEKTKIVYVQRPATKAKPKPKPKKKHQFKALVDTGSLQENFKPPIDANCPKGFRENQPGLCVKPGKNGHSHVIDLRHTIGK